MIELISPKNGVEISVLTDVHRAFLEGERTGLNKNVEALEKVILPIWRERFLEASACLYFKWRSTEAYVPEHQAGSLPFPLERQPSRDLSFP